MTDSKGLFAKRLSNKDKNALHNIVFDIFKKDPFVKIGLKSNKARKIWFEFVEQLTLTSLLIYFSQTTQNVLVRIMAIVSVGFWIFSLYAYLSIIKEYFLHHAVYKVRFWWQFRIVVFVLSALFIYFLFLFRNFLNLLH